MASPKFDLLARQHRKWVDGDPDGANGGMSAETIQSCVGPPANWLTQAEADEIIATGGNVGVLLMAADAPAS